MRTTAIENTQDVIDSRDVIARIETLTDELRDVFNDEKEGNDEQADIVFAAWCAVAAGDDEHTFQDSAVELCALLALQEEASGSPDWPHGETLIRESYFQEYAEQLAEDIGAVNPKATWPNNFIDWEAAADALKQDYFTVDFDGTEYLIRA